MNARLQNALIFVIIAKRHMYSSSSKLLLKRRGNSKERNPVKRNKSHTIYPITDLREVGNAFNRAPKWQC